MWASAHVSRPPKRPSKMGFDEVSPPGLQASPRRGRVSTCHPRSYRFCVRVPPIHGPPGPHTVREERPLCLFLGSRLPSLAQAGL